MHQYLLYISQWQEQLLSIKTSRGVHSWNRPCHQVLGLSPLHWSTMSHYFLSLLSDAIPKVDKKLILRQLVNYYVHFQL